MHRQVAQIEDDELSSTPFGLKALFITQTTNQANKQDISGSRIVIIVKKQLKKLAEHHAAQLHATSVSQVQKSHIAMQFTNKTKISSHSLTRKQNRFSKRTHVLNYMYLTGYVEMRVDSTNKVTVKKPTQLRNSAVQFSTHITQCRSGQVDSTAETSSR